MTKLRTMRHLLPIISLIVALTANATEPAREHHLINDGWRFYYAYELDSNNADYVTLPHTWNVDDTGCEGEYKRTTAYYTRTTWVPKEWEGRRVFLRFGGVQSVANLFVNGQHIGEHRGGFTAFTFEITDAINFGQKNYMRIAVSNDMRSDVLPISSNTDLCGGIYRDVELLVTPQSAISPLFYSSDGVLVEQQVANEQRASGVVHVYLSTPEDHHIVNMRIIAPDGYEVNYRTVKATKISPDRSINLAYDINHPELWSPANPTLYTIEVSIGDVEDPIDVVRIKTGFRSITISDDNKLCINGEHIAIHGVNMAHDRLNSATAITDTDIDNDLAIIEELGANAIRSIEGPHSRYLYDECDSRGILAWVDMPFARSLVGYADLCYYDSDAFRNNGFEQLKEVIYQNYNHPSVAMWGIFSLVSQNRSNIVDYIKQLNELAHTLDKSRPTVACSNSDGDINFVTDLIVLRQNVGWMKGLTTDVSIWCEQLRTNQTWCKLRSAVCYGEEGISKHNSDVIERAKRGERLLPARRQRLHHESYINQLEKSDQFWGVWLDNIFDYGSSRRLHGKCHTGLVEYDHTTKKDIFYLYRALWNDQIATLHITDKGWQNRSDNMQSITVYSSIGKPTLTINGETTELSEVGRNVWRSDTVRVDGEATIEASVAGHTAKDSASFRVSKH